MSYFLGDPWKRRIVYLADSKLAARFTGADTEDRSLLLLSQSGDLAVEPYSAFVNAHPSFSLVCMGGSWVLKKLAEDFAAIRVAGLFEGELRYQVFVGH